MATGQMNPAYLLDPSLYGDQQAVDQQRQLAQLLMTQGLSPMGGTESVGGVAIRRSPMEGAAKLAQILSGQSINQQANLATQGLGQRQTQAMLLAQQLLNANAPGAAPQGSGGVSGSAPAGPTGLRSLTPMQALLASTMYPKEYGEAYMKPYTPNDTSVKAMQAGVDPGTANLLGLVKDQTAPGVLEQQQSGMNPQEIYRSAFGKAARDAEISRRAQEGYSNAVTGEQGMIPRVPENANIVGVPGPNGAIQGVTPIPGAQGVQSGNAAATGIGKASTTPTVIYGADGTPQFSTELQNLMRAQGWTPPASGGPGNPQGFSPESLQEQIRQVQSNGGQPIKPADQPRIDREVAKLQAQLQASSVTPGPRPGVVTKAETASSASQKTLEERFTQLRDANGQAETTNSYLANIKELASKASTGQFADKLQYVNSLLSPFSESATDAVTANNLLNKYSNQIVARLGQGGLGTDAARSILQSAYPNAHMTAEAINEAADNLMGANRMIQAKAKLLSPLGNARDAAGYQQKEQAFDQAADPRIFQIANMTAEQAQKFIAKLPADVQADLRKRAGALRQMGAL